PPRDPVGAGHLRSRPARVDHRCHELVLQSPGRPSEPGDLVGGLGERAPGAQLLVAEPAPLGPHHLHRPGNRDVTHTLQPAGVDPLGHHSAVRAARRVGRLDHHPAPALGPVAGLDDAVVGQVEDRARSNTLRARRLVHRLVVLCLVDVSTTPITAGPRALTHLRRAGHFHHEPRRASLPGAPPRTPIPPRGRTPRPQLRAPRWSSSTPTAWRGWTSPRSSTTSTGSAAPTGPPTSWPPSAPTSSSSPTGSRNWPWPCPRTASTCPWPPTWTRRTSASTTASPPARASSPTRTSTCASPPTTVRFSSRRR